MKKLILVGLLLSSFFYLEDVAISRAPLVTPEVTISEPLENTVLTTPNKYFDEYSCDFEDKVKSRSGEKISVVFVNKTSDRVSIYWLDGKGNRILYKESLPVGSMYNQPTYTTHPWLITDKSNKCLKIYIPKISSTINID